MALTGAPPPLQENIMKSNIDKKFSAHYDAVEAELKSSTVGEQDTHATLSQAQGLLLHWPWVTTLPPGLLNSQVS